MQTVFLRRVVVAAIGTLGGLAQGQAFAEPCANAYEKSIPYSRAYADTNAKVDFHNTVTLRYNCKTFLTQTDGGIHANFYGVQADLIQAKVAADSGKDSAHLSFSALVLGYEVAHEDTQINEVYRKTFKPDQDLDLAKDSTLQVGPLAIPVRYGLQGTSALDVTAALRNFGAELTAVPSAKANAYLLAGIDVKLIKGSARGDLLLVDGQINNALGAHFSPRGETPTIDISAVGDLAFSAFDGSITASVQVPEGGKQKTYNSELFRWNGISKSARLYERSQKIADLPH